MAFLKAAAKAVASGLENCFTEAAMTLSVEFAQWTAAPGQALETWDALRAAPSFPKSEMSQKHADALLNVFGNSNFLARWAQRFPEKVSSVLQAPWEKTLALQEFNDDWQKRCPGFLSFNHDQLSAALVDFKYGHLFRITLKDLNHLAPFEEIVGELSDLAFIIVQLSLAWQQRDLARQWGVAQANSPARPIPYGVLAMGKLGGRELNFSSDLDLIYFYGNDEGRVLLQGKRLDLAPHEYFSKLSERLTRFLSAKTSEGFLYRIDLELRPEGKDGTLANSLDAMESYYETFGADWEKQAMIKAAWAAGDPALIAEFLRRMHPFVYPKITAYPILAGIRGMKEKIIQSVRQKHPESFHVKLGDGGIREIEFFVQSMQLLFGGNAPALQTPNTLQALRRLHAAKLIETGERKALVQAYVFLRNLEHRLQLVEEQQTHSMPTTDVELGQLARRMGYLQANAEQARDAFLEDLERHRTQVMGIFNDLLSHRFGE